MQLSADKIAEGFIGSIHMGDTGIVAAQATCIVSLTDYYLSRKGRGSWVVRAPVCQSRPHGLRNSCSCSELFGRFCSLLFRLDETLKTVGPFCLVSVPEK